MVCPWTLSVFGDARLPSYISTDLGVGTVLSYERQATVCARADLRLVDVDEYSRVSQWSSTSIAFHDALVRPSYGLFMDEANSCFRSRLRTISSCNIKK